MAAASGSGASAFEGTVSKPWTLKEWTELQGHAAEIEPLHLRDLDEKRCASLRAEAPGFVVDYSRQRVTADTMSKLFAFAKAAGLQEKIKAMADGKKINVTENRAVMHMALRAPKSKSGAFKVDGNDVVADVHSVLDRIKSFSEDLRSGKWVGATGKPIKNVISIGIGGSYLGPEFVFEALRRQPECAGAAKGRTLRFLANVDPVDVERATEGLDPEETMVVVVSKTFTTAETMLNARTMRSWLLAGMGEGKDEADVIAKHYVAVSSSVDKATAFGVKEENVFGFWDWVGGRYSVCSAVGVLTLSLQYGFDQMRNFLDGAAQMDEHFLTAAPESNLPVLLGLLGVWNSTFQGHGSRALLPYSQALLRFAAHIQQVDMESNGKRVAVDGTELPFDAGEVDFGEPGTNGQHSFYQLVHQGRTVPADFLGFCEPQTDRLGEGEPVSNHDELMSNFFAQPDALARGKSAEDLEKEGVSAELIPHKTFPGNRPSTSILMDRLDAFSCGQLLALYEHRTAVQGFLWGIPSFDQWGVELGKVLAKQVRGTIQGARAAASGKEGEGAAEAVDATVKEGGYNPSTQSLLGRYLRSRLAGGAGAGAAAGGGK